MLKTTSLLSVSVHAFMSPDAKLSWNTSFSFFGSAVGNGLGDGIGVAVGVGVSVGLGVELDEEEDVEDELVEELDDLEGLIVAFGVGVGSSVGGGVGVASGGGVGVGEGSVFWYVDRNPELKVITVTATATKRTKTLVSAKRLLFFCIVDLPKSRFRGLKQAYACYTKLG